MQQFSVSPFETILRECRHSAVKRAITGREKEAVVGIKVEDTRFADTV